MEAQRTVYGDQAVIKRGKPVWVVTLRTRKRRGKPAEHDVKYVRAADSNGAIRCARFWSMLPRSAYASARLASPVDLGATRVEQRS